MKTSKNHKSSRTRSSTSTTNSNTSNTTSSLSKPLTPLKRFFFKLEFLGSSPSVSSFLGKRRRDELPDHEAGFQHLHAYDHGANVEKALDSHQVVEDIAITASTEVYAKDGTRKWSKKPAGPRLHKKASTNGPSPLRAAAEGGSQSLTTPRHVSHSTRRDRSARVALQNIDTFLDEDAVIITALDNIPFNSHEELLSMSREELVNVALDLNSKLPQALSIDTSEDRPLTFIRNAIEVLVGIRPDVPAAPLRVGKMKIPVGSDQPRFLEEFSFERWLEDSSPLATPLTSRKRTDGDGVSGLNNILRVHPQRLETLEEAEVEEESVHRESFGRKRRRLSDENEDSDIVMRSDSARSLVQPHSNLLQPPPMPREPIDGFLPPPSAPTSPPRSPPRRVLRSHSRRLRSNAQGTDNFSTALTCAMLESGYEARARRRRRANNNGNGNVKRNRQASFKSTASSATSEDQRNSIVFPTNQSSCAINNMRRQGSSESSKGNTSTGSSDAIVSIPSSRLAKSPSQSLQSTQSEQRSTASESDSPIVSIRSAHSSVSKMSICTRLTRGRLAASGSGYSDDSNATSRGVLGGSMDVSL